MQQTVLLLHRVYFKAKLTSSSGENPETCCWMISVEGLLSITVHLKAEKLHSSAIYFVSLILKITKTANTFPKYWYRCNKETSMDSICSPGSFWLTHLAEIEAVWLSYLKLLCDFKFPLCGPRQPKAWDLFSELHTDRYWQECQCVTRAAVYTHTHTDTHMRSHTCAQINGLQSIAYLAQKKVCSC